MESLYYNSVCVKSLIRGSFYNNNSYEDFRYELNKDHSNNNTAKSTLYDIFEKIHATKFFNLPYRKIYDLSKISKMMVADSIYYESFYYTKFCNINNPKRVNTKYLGD